MPEPNANPAAADLKHLLRDEVVQLHNGAGALRPRRVVEDSRLVESGDVFLARPGASVDGRELIDVAIEGGAQLILTDQETACRLACPCIGADEVQGVGARLAHALADWPTAHMAVTGITGTNGKSTCAWLLQHVLQVTGHACGLVGGIQNFDGRGWSDAALTTPPACELASLLSSMQTACCTHVAMEVSSQGIATGRIEGVEFATGIFTNLSGDHLDLHGDLETYAAIKCDWMASLGQQATRIINTDDAVGRRLAKRCGGRGDVLTCGRGGDLQVERHDASLDGQTLGVHTPWGSAEVHLSLVGEHNAFNALQVAAAASVAGCELEAIASAMASARPPRGRLDRVPAPPGSPRVFVDFAHTDGALDSACGALARLVPAGGRLILVMGCGGDRDQTKRPRMGRVGAAHADLLWLTSDNPRSEDPEAIIDMIEAGVPVEHRVRVRRTSDRRKAIEAALAQAGAGDVVLIAGKGHEALQIVGDEALPFDDARVAAQVLAQGTGHDA
ncbi:MAG: UDP-N-acetylmuramoyl-L-alanyl-D-glutamate--2,6-diaminopimelate ligase [Phycisphaerales bacterium]|nr:UDP-N-acetylmuramoyl-L-alanyl-D-glutamate--2,6-diaminopimelate ligase [Phycisphaerales bacterium]